MTPFPKGGRHKDSTKKKISKSLIGNKRRLGIKHKPEDLHKMSSPGPGNPRWRGGRTKDRSGRILIWCPGHPRAHNGRYVYEHILIVEHALGRPLPKSEIVHHINGDPSDNRNCNLLVCTKSYHFWLTLRMARLYQKEHFGGN